MAKAEIYVLDNDGNKNKDSEPIEVMFNPSEYSTAVSVTWKEEKESSIPQLIGSNYDKFTVNLLFDTYEKQVDVREDHIDKKTNKKIAGTKRLIELTFPIVEGTNRKNPPVCLFSWGKFNFKGYIEKVDQKFTMFLKDGMPVRAYVTITMKPVVSASEMLKLKGIAESRKVRIVKEGDRLDLIASEEMKNPSMWRKIAEANNISDPFDFPGPEDIGKILIIPDKRA